MDFKDRLRELRLKKGYTLEQFGELVGLQKAAIYKYEQGLVVNPKRGLIENMAKVLNVSPAYLMGWDNEQNIRQDGYYTDPEVAALAEEMRTNPEMKVLFSASKSLTKEQMLDAYNYIKFLKSKERNDYTFSEDNSDGDFNDSTNDGDFAE